MPSPIGAISKPQSIAKWILECLTDEVTDLAGKKTALTHIALCHSPSDKEIFVQPMKGKAADAAALMGIAETIYGRAEADAEGLSSRQTYVLYGFYEGCNNQPSRRKPVMVNGTIVNSLGDHSTEPATAEGRSMQRMRHDEAYSQTLVHGNATLVGQALNFGTVMADRAIKAAEREAEMFYKMQGILMEMSLNHQKAEMERAQFERNTKLMEQGMKLAPAILNTLTGKEIVPQSLVDTSIVETLSDALDEETTAQVLAIVGPKVNPAALGVFFKRLSEIAEKKRAGEKRVADALVQPLASESDHLNGTGSRH